MGVETIIIVGLYLVGLGVVSWYSKKRAEKGGTAFLLAGRELSWFLVSMLLVGFAVGGASTIGVSERAYQVGISAGWYDTAWAVGAIVAAFTIGSPLRRVKFRSVSELIKKVYGGKASVLNSIIQILVQVVILCLQYVSAGAILATLFPNLGLGKATVISALVFLLIGLFGGILSAALTNIINIIIIYTGILLAFVVGWRQVGGIEGVKPLLPPGPWFDPIRGLGPIIVLSWFVIFIFYASSAQTTLQMIQSARDERNAKLGFLVAAPLMIPAGWICAYLGVMAKAKFPNIIPTEALPTFVYNLPHGNIIAAITFSGIWAAAISTGVALEIGTTTVILEDIVKRFIQISPKKEVLASRIILVIVTIIGALLGFKVTGILKTLMVALALMVPVTILIWAYVYAPRFTSKLAGWTTLLVGLIVFILWLLVPAIHVVPHLVYLEIAACVPVYIITSIIGKEKIAPSSS